MSLSELLRGPVTASTLESYFQNGLGTVLTCEVLSGVIRVGDSLKIRQVGVGSKVVNVAGIEMKKQLWQEAYPTDSVGLLIKDIDISYFTAGAQFTSVDSS